MSLKALWLYLSNDVPSTVTTTASGVQALNSDIWLTASSVPAYAYQSLGQMLVSSSCSSSQLALHVVYKEGEALENSRSEIALLGSSYESVELPREGFNLNTIGAETMHLDIGIRLPEETQNWDLISNVEFRVRYLIDQVWRRKRKSTSAYIPNLGDNTVDGQIFCNFCEYLRPPNAKEIWVRYSIAFTRAVPR